uniref:Uncharacterized protein n=1 Tax=Spongospora subterranea TaxID=70186 RepID=A0A0H5QIM6_9EUKA|eukprot:CRZ01935.1 hypothetical protein [Spongospora subterranea]
MLAARIHESAAEKKLAALTVELPKDALEKMLEAENDVSEDQCPSCENSAITAFGRTPTHINKDGFTLQLLASSAAQVHRQSEALNMYRMKLNQHPRSRVCKPGKPAIKFSSLGQKTTAGNGINKIC